MRMTRKIRRAWLRGKPEWAKCYLLKQRMRKKTKVVSFAEKKNRLHNYSRYLVAGVMLACLGIGQASSAYAATTANVSVKDSQYANTVVKKGSSYEIYNQQVNDNGSALNKFIDFQLGKDNVANLHLEGAYRQINLVDNKVVIDGVLNSLRENGMIGGDIYFFSGNGIAVGATGVINVGSLTLGTNMSAGQIIFNDWDKYNKRTITDKARSIAGGGDITISGKVNSIGDVILGAKNVNVEAGASINTGASFEVLNSAWTTADDYRSNFMNLTGVDKATSATKTSTGDVVLFGASAVNFKGDAYTAGGDFKVVSDSFISFTGTSSSDRATIITNGGDVSLSVQRDERANVKIDLKNANIDASDKVSTQNGNVDVVASTIAETFSWAMEGNKAEINIDTSDIKGDNVNIAAVATISGEVAEYDEDVQFTDEEIEKNWKDAIEKHDDGVLDLMHDTIGFDIQNLRTLTSATVVEVNSAITVKDSKIDAIGGTKVGTESGEEVTHGNLNMLTVGNSRITTNGLGFFNFSVVVGMSDVDSKLIITDSDLYAENHINLAAKGDNKVELTYLDLSLADMVPKFNEVGVASAGFNWAELNSDVAVTVDKASTLKARNNVGISAEAIRNLMSTTVAGGDTDKIGVVASVALADTKSEAKVEGEIYAGGDVTVSALNSIYKDENGFYTPDTSTAESMSGDTFLGKPIVNAVKHGINGLGQKIFNKTAFDLNGVPGKGKDWGVNAATAVLISENDAIASVTGKVRGFDGSDTVGANKLEVKAENISRTSMGASAYQNKLTDLSGNTINSKDTGISLAVNAGFQDNTAKAYIGGDIKVKDTINVNAVTKIPWQTDFTNFTLSGIIGNIFGSLTDPNLGVSNLVDSWSQASATTNKVGGAGSVGVMEYASTAEAYIDKNAKVASGGTININALTDVTTVNFSGNITSPITMMPLAIWQGVGNLFKLDMWGASGETVAIGGAALAVRQKNVAKAYIADSDVDGAGIKGSATASNVNVEASNEGVNLGMLASGGTSETVAIDGTVGVFRVENEADAHIGQANVNASKDVTVTAKDKSHIINLAGVIASGSTSASIGATVAYNHIDRDTSAYINGNVTAGEKISIDALNDGLIVATSLAGAIAYNEVPNGTATGSQGARAHNEVEQPDGTISVEMDELDGTGNVIDDIGGLLNVSGANIFDENNVDVDTGENTISNVANQDQGAGAAKGKNAFAVSANVGVNRVLDDATAYVAPSANIKENTPINPILNADFVRVTSKNDSEIVAANATASINTTAGKASTGIAGTFMYNSITSSNDAFVNNATITVCGNTEAGVDEALTITAENLEKILNISISGTIAPKGNGIVGQVGVNRIDNDTYVYIEDSVIRADEKTTVKADDGAEIQSYTGAVSVTGGAFGVGASIGVQDIDTDTSAYISGMRFTNTDGAAKGGDVYVLADENSKIVSIVATAGVGLNTAMVVEASVSANDVDTSTKAYIDNDESIKADAIKVAARNMANSTVGVGQIGVAKTAIGVASAIALSSNNVEAYIKGDDTSNSVKNKIEADSIDVTATNIYNGSAKDGEEDDTTAKTVAVGGAVGYNTAAGAGSVTVNIIKNNTKAHLDQGVYETTGAINVNAQSKAYMFGLAGGVSVGKGAGVGAAVDTQLLEANTQAYIADNVGINRAGNITISADSYEKITSVAVMAAGGQYFAGAAVANAHEIDVDTIAYIGNDTVADDAKTTLENVGNVTVTAKDDVDLTANAGGASVNISGSGGVSGTLGAAVEVLDKNVKASVGTVNIKGNSLKVKAENTGDLITTANGIAVAAALYGGGVAGSASESIVDYATDAHIASGATVTVDDDVTIDADSIFTHVGEAAAVGGGTIAGIGLSNDTTVFTAATDAYIGKATIIANNNVNDSTEPDGVSVTADSLVDITSAVAAGAGGIGVVTGGVGVNVIDTSTKAYIGASANIASNNTASDGGVVVAAQDITQIEGGSGGLAVAGGGVGAAVNVNDITKQTLAYVGSDAEIKSAGITTISAHSIEEIYNVSIQATGGALGGLAGAVGVHNIDVVTKAYADTGADIIDADDDNAVISGGNVKVEAKHEVGISSTVVGATTGGVNVGAAVDVANVVSQTNAFVGNNAIVKTAGNLDVVASELDKDITYKVKNENGIEETKTANMGSHTAAGSISGLTVSGSVSVYSFGSGMTEEDANLLNTNSNGNKHTNSGGYEISFDDWLNGQLDQSSTDKAMGEYKGNTVANSIGNKLGDRNISTTVTSKPTNNTSKTTASTAGGEGTIAKIGSGAKVDAANVTVKADSNIEMESNVGTGVAGVIAAGASVGVVNNNSKISAVVDNSAEITATSNVLVQADSLSKLNGLSVAPGVGLFVGAAAAMDLNSNTKVTTSIANSAKLDGNNITIEANNTPVLNASSTGAYAGLVSAVGAVTALVDSEDDAIVNIGDSVNLDADEKIKIAAENKKYSPQNNGDDFKYNYYVKAEAGSGGVVTTNVVVSHINAYNDTTVTIGKLGTITAKQLEVLAKHEDSLNYEVLSAGAAGVSGTGSDHRVNIDSDVAVNIAYEPAQTTDDEPDVTINKTQITTTEDVSIKAENKTYKDWLDATDDDKVGLDDYNALSAGASVAGGTGIVNKTEITHNTDVNLGDVIVKANAAALTTTEQAQGISLADKNAIDIDAYSYVKSKDYQYIGTGAVIEAAEIDDDNTVHANTNVNVGVGTVLHAGDVEEAKAVSTHNRIAVGEHENEAIGGGNVSVGARNDAEMYSKTYVNTWGGVGVVGATNDVVFDGTANVNFAGRAETAKGDVRLAAGRNSSGDASVINVTADGTLLNGTIIPISHTKNPTAKVYSDTQITVGTTARIESDADIYLQTNAGTINALGTGEVHDWAHAIGEIFDSSCWKTGSSSVEKSANVEVNGHLETGIHRDQKIIIGGVPKTDAGYYWWNTNVEHSNGIRFELSNMAVLKNELSERLDELKDLRAAYIADPNTTAIYDKEINLLQNQMVELGFAHYEMVGDTQAFVEYGYSSSIGNSNIDVNELYTTSTINEIQGKLDELSAYITSLDNNSEVDPSEKAFLEETLYEMTKFVKEKEDAYNAFTSEGFGGTVSEDGKFMKGNVEYYSYTKDASGNFDFSEEPLNEVIPFISNNQVKLKEITVKLGDIIVEGDNLYGTGTLHAKADANVTIINNSPNDLIVNDIKVIGNRTEENKYYNGSNVSFNGVNVSSGEDIEANNKDKFKTVAFAEIKDNTNTSSIITIQNNFNPSEHTVNELNITGLTDVDDSEKLFSASSITVAGDARIYNPHGSVVMESSYGDVYNYGTIDAEAVDIKVNNGSYVQEIDDESRIVNVGGDPGKIYDSQHDNDSTTNETLGSGIFANGNIIIKARYVNINSTIQSGRAPCELTIPSDYLEQLYYYDSSGSKQSVEDISDVYASVTLYVDGCDDHITYDRASDHFILAGLDFQGGNVDITGTILNTSSNGEGKIIALDGYGSIKVDNQTNKVLEIRDISTGDGGEGVIKITDLNRDTGVVEKTTTYTRKNGKLYVNNVESESETLEYEPDNHYYVWQSGQDSSTVTEYHYSDSKAVIWWKDGSFSDKNLEDMDVVSVTSGDAYDLADGTLVTGTHKIQLYDSAKRPVEVTAITSDSVHYYDVNGVEVIVDLVPGTSNNDGYTEYRYKYTTSTSKPYDERIETHRVWYTLGIKKVYDHWFKIKTGSTTITRKTLEANNPIGIEFIGAEGGGNLTVTGSSADVILNGMISNVNGDTSITGKNIVQGTDGYIKTKDLVLNATNNVGALDKLIQTDADYLSGSAGQTASGMFAVEVWHGSVELGNISAKDTAYIKSAGDIAQLNGTTVTAKRVELDSQTGGIGSSTDALDISVEAPSDKVKNAAYGLNAKAADGIYINNIKDKGDLYIDRVVSHTGDVELTTKGSFIDNNDNDIFDETAAEKLLRWGHGQILAGVESTAKLQKEMLITKAQNKYNRYQLLSKMANENDEIVLSDLEVDAIKRTLYEQDRKEETNKYINNDEAVTNFINEYVADLQKEYDVLVSENAHTWTDTALEAYVANIEAEFSRGISNADETDNNNVNSYSSTLFAKADLETISHNFASDGGIEFLTTDEKTEILVGSARAKENMLVTNGPGMLKEVTDTNLVIKTVPNVKGKNVTLTNADTNNADAAIGSASEITGAINPVEIVDILEKAESEWTTDDKQKIEFYEAYLAAERGDVVTNSNGTMTITVAKPIVVEVSGEVNAVAKSDVLLASESDVIVDEITSGGEVRLKANGNVIGSIDEEGEATTSQGAITATERVILESAQGSITGIKLVEASNSSINEEHELIARAAEDITISKAGDLVVDTIYSANGKIMLDVSGTDGIKNDITALDTGNGAELNISGVNIELLGVDNLGEANHYIGLKGRVGEEANAGKITANAGGDVYINTYGNINAPEISGKTISAVNFAAITGGELKATNGSVDVVNNSSIIGTSLVSETDAVKFEANAGSVTQDAVITAKETVTYKANAGTETQAVIVNAEKTIDIDAASDVGFAAISTDESVDIDSNNGASVNVEQVEAQSLEVVVAQDISIGSADVVGKADLRAGNDVNVDMVEAEELVANADEDINIGTANVGSVAGLYANGDVSVSAIEAQVLVAEAENDITVGTASITSGAELTADNDVSVNAIETQDLAVEAGHDVSVETASVGENAYLTAGNDVSVGEISAQSLGVSAVNGIEVETAHVEGTADMSATEDVVVKVIKANNMNAEAGRDVSVETASIGNTAYLTAGNDVGVGEISAQNLGVSAGKNIEVETAHVEDTADMSATEDIVVKTIKTNNMNAETGRDVSVETASVGETANLTADNDVSVNVIETQALAVESGNNFNGQQIVAHDIGIIAGNDITVSSKEAVNSLAGVTPADPNSVNGTGPSAGKLTGEVRTDYTSYADDKGSAALVGTGSIKLEAGETVAIDTLVTNDNVAQIEANMVGVDDAQNMGDGATQISIDGSKGDATYYVGIGTSDNNPLNIIDSTIENLSVNAIDNVGLYNTTISGDATINAGRVQVDITRNENNPYSINIGELSISDSDIITSEYFAYVIDGVTINGSHRTPTHLACAEDSLYAAQYAGKDGDDDEREDNKETNADIEFSEIVHHEEYEKI